MDNGVSSYRRFVEGEEAALGEIVEEYGNNLILFINKYINNLSISEDIMEDTFVSLIVHKHYFRGESSLKTYLFKIGRNKAINYLKKNKRIAQMPDELEDETKLEDIVIKSETNKAIYSALGKLKKEYATVLYLIYFEKMSYEQCAKIMKKNKKQIKNLAYRAREKLREILETVEIKET